MQRLDPKMIESLKKQLLKFLTGDKMRIQERERAALAIQQKISEIALKLGLTGEVKMFGSFLNGFKTGSSDLDIVFLTTAKTQDIVSQLSRFAADCPERFHNVTKIFKANTPLLKFTDSSSQMEVDFCINNRLGVRNSLLLLTYCQYDERLAQLGRLVKEWAKAHELVGTADGYLNSYAYMLLVIHFAQRTSPPVVPNLQKLAKESVIITDDKWGIDSHWDTKFVEDLGSLPKSSNKQDLAELIVAFFHYWAFEFDWSKHACCMRLCEENVAIDKYSLMVPTNEDQWYIEDPFDLKHNLAGKCSRAGKTRIKEDMRETYQALFAAGDWTTICPTGDHESYFLKCRVSQGVSPQHMLEEFEEFDLKKLYFPKVSDKGRLGPAFLEFASHAARRKAHSKNETYVSDCQLQLHFSTSQGLADVLEHNVYATYDMASYKMQRQILEARSSVDSRQESQEYLDDQLEEVQEEGEEEPWPQEQQLGQHQFDPKLPPFQPGMPMQPAAQGRGMPPYGMPPQPYGLKWIPMPNAAGMQPLPAGMMPVMMRPGMHPPPPQHAGWQPTAEMPAAMQNPGMVAKVKMGPIPKVKNQNLWQVPEGMEDASMGVPPGASPWVVPEGQVTPLDPNAVPVDPKGVHMFAMPDPQAQMMQQQPVAFKKPTGVVNKAVPQPKVAKKQMDALRKEEADHALGAQAKQQKLMQKVIEAPPPMPPLPEGRLGKNMWQPPPPPPPPPSNQQQLQQQQQQQQQQQMKAQMKQQQLQQQAQMKQIQVQAKPKQPVAKQRLPQPEQILSCKVEVPPVILSQDICKKLDSLKEWRKELEAGPQAPSNSGPEIHLRAAFANETQKSVENLVGKDKMATIRRLAVAFREF